MVDDEEPADFAGGPVGVGGWLLVPVAGLLLMLARGLAAVLDVGDLEGVSRHLNDQQRAFVIAEIVGDFLLLFLLPLVLLVLLTLRKRSFPRLYVLWAVLAFLFVVAQIFLGNALFLDAAAAGTAVLFDPGTLGVLAGAAFLVVLWVPYMLASRRVRNTFVN